MTAFRPRRVRVATGFGQTGWEGGGHEPGKFQSVSKARAWSRFSRGYRCDGGAAASGAGIRRGRGTPGIQRKNGPALRGEGRAPAHAPTVGRGAGERPPGATRALCAGLLGDPIPGQAAERVKEYGGPPSILFLSEAERLIRER